MKTVLVVGGAGYIGSHMVLMLRDAGYRVVVLDNLSRGHADAVKDAQLEIGDLRSVADVDRVFRLARFDVVMHFAALAYVAESVAQPDLYYQNNVVGAINLLSAMVRHGVRNMVFSSTCATYGEPISLPIDEQHAQSPINPYGRTKLMIEHALGDYAVAHGLRSISLRYFNAAGCDLEGRAGERHGPETHLIPLVLGEALRVRDGGKADASTLTVMGLDFPTADGTCVRDYVHVTDLCRAHLLAAERLWDGAVSGAEAFNLSNGRGYSVLEVIDACRRVTGIDIRYRVDARRAGDPGVLVGDSTRARHVLGWMPRHSDLVDMIASAWRFMLAHRQGMEPHTALGA